jgi:hypothetical protein
VGTATPGNVKFTPFIVSSDVSNISPFGFVMVVVFLPPDSAVTAERVRPPFEKLSG